MAGTISRPESTPIANTAYTGTRCLETRRQRRCPGTAPSRENANIIRDADVVDAVTQKNWATTQIASSASDQFSFIDSRQIQGITAPMLSRAPWVLGIAKVTATSRTKPKMTETTTDMYIPTAAIRDAWWVSSAMCAEASKPVIVYCDISSPRPKTSQKTAWLKPVTLLPYPVAFTVWPKTYPADWWWSGTTISTITITATPAMCQYAETVLSSEVMRTSKTLIRHAASRKSA